MLTVCILTVLNCLRVYSHFKRSSPRGRDEQSEVWRRHFQVSLEFGGHELSRFLFVYFNRDETRYLNGMTIVKYKKNICAFHRLGCLCRLVVTRYCSTGVSDPTQTLVRPMSDISGCKIDSTCSLRLYRVTADQFAILAVHPVIEFGNFDWQGSRDIIRVSLPW